MKLNFQDLNIEPMPNPKPLTVRRVQVEVNSVDGKVVSSGEGRIINACVHPAALIERRW